MLAGADFVISKKSFSLARYYIPEKDLDDLIEKMRKKVSCGVSVITTKNAVMLVEDRRLSGGVIYYYIFKLGCQDDVQALEKMKGEML